MEEEKIKVYSYAKVWKHEKKIYNVMNWILPTPVNPYDLAGFCGMLLLILLLGRIFPPIQSIPGAVRYLLLPYGATYLLRRKTMDGKNPIWYLAGMVSYYLTVQGTYVEGWKRHRDSQETIRLSWFCSRGRRGEENG